MSDFLGRIAARAVGVPALAQPQLLAQPSGTGGDDLEVVEEEVVVPGTAPRALARPSAERSRTEPAPTSPEVRPKPASPAEPREALPTTAATPRAPAADRREHPLPAPEQPVAAVPTEAAPATPAAPVLSAPTVPAPPAAAATPRDEPPPVRVHIGRLEVRANLSEAPRPEPRPEPLEPDALSLSDYLQGKREA